MVQLCNWSDNLKYFLIWMSQKRIAKINKEFTETGLVMVRKKHKTKMMHLHYHSHISINYIIFSSISTFTLSNQSYWIYILTWRWKETCEVLYRSRHKFWWKQKISRIFFLPQKLYHSQQRACIFPKYSLLSSREDHSYVINWRRQRYHKVNIRCKISLERIVGSHFLEGN